MFKSSWAAWLKEQISEKAQIGKESLTEMQKESMNKKMQMPKESSAKKGCKRSQWTRKESGVQRTSDDKWFSKKRWFFFSFLFINSCDSDSWAELLLAFTLFFYFVGKMFAATI